MLWLQIMVLCCFIRMSMNNLKDIHNICWVLDGHGLLFYQDVNEQFEGYTQQRCKGNTFFWCCFIRMSMNNLKDIHNCPFCTYSTRMVVLSGCQWTIWRIYTTPCSVSLYPRWLFYQDVNEQFEGYTQLRLGHKVAKVVVLSGCQWTIWRIYTTTRRAWRWCPCCFIRMSMNNLKDIHNKTKLSKVFIMVVLSGCQWTIFKV